MSISSTVATCSGCGAEAPIEVSSWVDPPEPPPGWQPYHQPSGVIYCPSCLREIEAATTTNTETTT